MTAHRSPFAGDTGPSRRFASDRQRRYCADERLGSVFPGLGGAENYVHPIGGLGGEGAVELMGEAERSRVPVGRVSELIEIERSTLYRWRDSVAILRSARAEHAAK